MSPPDWREMTRVFGRIGLLSFGGPAAQIALMHRELVETRNWLSEQSYLRALSLCMLLPGPEAMQLATYAGWRLRGTAGGVLAGLLFVIPGAVVIAVLALLYANYGQLPAVQSAFLGIKAAVIVVVFQALRKVAGKALVGASGHVLAALAFVALFAFAVPFPIIIIAAGLFGMWRAPADHDPLDTVPVTAQPLLTLLIWGSAYAVLGYMTQTVVSDLGWITADQMIDALGLAETTPGPLILVTEFMALLAGFAQSGISGALAAGLLALWVTFCPCFLWIFLAGPYLERLSAQPRLAGALQAITAAVVGVIANLPLWFALHVWFGAVGTVAGIALPLPVWSSFDPLAIALTAGAALLMVGLRVGFVPTMAALALCAWGAATI